MFQNIVCMLSLVCQVVIIGNQLFHFCMVADYVTPWSEEMNWDDWYIDKLIWITSCWMEAYRSGSIQMYISTQLHSIGRLTLFYGIFMVSEALSALISGAADDDDDRWDQAHISVRSKSQLCKDLWSNLNICNNLKIYAVKIRITMKRLIKMKRITIDKCLFIKNFS